MAYGFFKIIKGLVIREEGTLTPKEIDIVPGGSASTKTTVTSSQTTDKTLTLPDATDTLIGKNTTDTLTNKTLTAPVINSPTGITKGDVGLGNVDNTSDATKNAAAVTLTNKTLDTTNDINVKSQAHFIISDETDITKKVQFNVANVGTGSTQTLTVNGAGTIATSTNIVTLSNKTIDADINTITNIENADIKASAAIAYSKLNLTGSVVNADLASGIDATKIADGSISNTEFQFLNGVSSNIQDQLNSTVTNSSTTTFTNKTFDADGTGNSITNIENADIKASAAIDATKIANGSVSNTEFQYLDGVTSAIQAQINAIVATIVPVGAVFPYAGATAPLGYILSSGRTIGNASSGGTERANADTSDLFTLLWDSFANTELAIQDSTGAGSTRGASAAADFAANKRMPVPDLRGRVPVGKDNMSGTTASRITSGGAGIVGTTLGASGGAQTHVLTTAQLASHTHTQNAHTHAINSTNNASTLGGARNWFPAYVTNTGTAGVMTGSGTTNADTTATNQNTGSDTAHQNTQPSLILNYLMKL